MDTRHGVQESTIWKAEPRKNYGGTFAAQKDKISCYTKKQMKSLYPAGRFQARRRVCGRQQNEKDRPAGGWRVQTLPVFKYSAHSRLLYREKGFAAVGGDSYAVLLQSVIVPRALILAACAAVIALGIIFGPGLIGRDQQAIADEDLSLAQSAATPDLEQGAVDWEGVQPRDTVRCGSRHRDTGL